jgi:ribosome-binding factor A
MKRGYDRLLRVGDLIQKTLAQILIEESRDDRFKLVTITSVTVARDMSFAKVYVTVLEEDKEKVKAIVQGLNHATKYLRYTLAHRIDLRIVPELKFIYDDSTERGFRISNLINEALDKIDDQSTKKE